MQFTFPEIKRLYERTLEIFSKIPQVAKIAIYGSAVGNNFDRYSDLDVEVQLSEWNPLSSKVEPSLKKVGTPFVVFPAVNDPGNGVLTVLWKDYPFYQKLDMHLFSLDDPISDDSTIVYESKKEIKNKQGTRKRFKLSFDESRRPFYDLFIGATRFTKHSSFSPSE